MEHRYKIFNKSISFCINRTNAIIEKALLEQLAVYQQTNDEPDIYIIVCDKLPTDKIKLSNPSIHKEVQNGFILEEPKFSVLFQIQKEKLHIFFQLKPQGGAIVKYLKKLNNIEYASLEERIPQIVWEQGLIPSVYFDPKTCINTLFRFCT